jgi:hypothetical protein
VEQIDLFTAQIQWNAQLFGDGVVLRTLRDRPEIVAKLFDGAAIGCPAEHHVLRVRVEAREVAQQVADVRTDAVVPHFAGIDGDSQDTRFYRGSWPLSRR